VNFCLFFRSCTLTEVCLSNYLAEGLAGFWSLIFRAECSSRSMKCLSEKQQGPASNPLMCLTRTDGGIEYRFSLPTNFVVYRSFKWCVEMMEVIQIVQGSTLALASVRADDLEKLKPLSAISHPLIPISKVLSTVPLRPCYLSYSPQHYCTIITLLLSISMRTWQ